ncbi:MAG: hypothetical protein N2035_06710 [Chthoniobacterales bacterium]|nr:hypothetical protein [Chthoniobacterales bacterium]
MNPETLQKLESTSVHAKAALDATAEAAKQVSEAVRQHAKTAYEVSKEHLTAAAKDLSDAANFAVKDLRGQALEAWTAAADQAKNFQTRTEEYIRTKPLQAVAVAFAFGVILGFLARR